MSDFGDSAEVGVEVFVVPGRHLGQGPEKPLCCWVWAGDRSEEMLSEAVGQSEEWEEPGGSFHPMEGAWDRRSWRRSCPSGGRGARLGGTGLLLRT